MLSLHFKSSGQGPALIVLHGLFGSLDNWATLAKAFAEDHSVFLVDQRNHGRSPHAEPWDYPTMAEDLHDFMDQQGIMQAHLLGHSMGGKVVMTFAGAYPERIDRLIVADMGIRQYQPHHQEILKALTELDLANLSSRQDAQDFLASQIQDPSVVAFLLKSLGRDEEKMFQWKFHLKVIARDYDHILAPVSLDFAFEGPTLFLTGADSNYVRKEDHEEIKQHFPAATFEEIKGAGHWIHADQPVAFTESVLGFLRGRVSK